VKDVLRTEEIMLGSTRLTPELNFKAKDLEKKVKVGRSAYDSSLLEQHYRFFSL
jgi:hypothetical protein